MILVVANYRTGSTTACQEIAGKYNYINEDEVFSYDRQPGCQYEFNRLIVGKKTNVVIKLMPNHITAAEKVIPNFMNKLIEASEKIYYTTRLDFYAQCKSWITCWITNQWHDANIPPKQPMFLTVDPVFFHEQATYLMSKWIMLEELYKQNSGECILLENRKPCGSNAPYTFNKQDINNAAWPKLDNQLIKQFNNLTIIKQEII